MPGGRSPKRKGYVFETELIELAKASKIPAVRAWGSNGAALQCHPTVDCLIGDQRVQAKRRAAIPSWLGLSEHVDAVAVRENRGETYVVMRFSDWLDLVAAKEVTR